MGRSTFIMKPALLATIAIVDFSYNIFYQYASSTFISPLAIIGQPLLQILAIADLFFMLTDTVLFQLGILAPLFSYFSWTMKVYAVYSSLTLLVCIYQVIQLYDRDFDLRSTTFQSLAGMHRLVAIAYYYETLMTVIKLSDVMFYEKSIWVAEFSRFRNYDVTQHHNTAQHGSALKQEGPNATSY